MTPNQKENGSQQKHSDKQTDKQQAAKQTDRQKVVLRYDFQPGGRKDGCVDRHKGMERQRQKDNQ